MENTRARINFFSVFSAIWRSKPEDGEQEEVIGKLAPNQAIELKRSLARAEKIGKELNGKVKSDFIKNANVKGEIGKDSKGNIEKVSGDGKERE